MNSVSSRKQRTMRTISLTQTMLSGFDSITKIFRWIGCAIIVLLALTTFVDVAGRYCFNRPIPGSPELIELGMGLLCSLAILYTTTEYGHVVVDLLLPRFSKRFQAIVNGAGSLLGFALWAVLAPKVFLNGISEVNMGLATGILFIPIGPFVSILGAGLFLCCLANLINALGRSQLDKKEGCPNL
jgi:TRAP-type C4-dicarboxylate transport system permease small subunit